METWKNLTLVIQAVLTRMEFWKDLTSVIQAALTSIAIVVGGFWTYFIFVRERLCKLSHFRY